MKVCAVVSEFNPFHNGHKYLLDEIRKKGYDAIVCVMSGNFVQRGEYAVCDKKIRARMAVDAGADLVISLPFPWSSASAELFARGAISVLKSLCCIDAIAFGSECGDIDHLRKCSEFLSEITPEKLKELQKKEPQLSYAQVRQNVVKQVLGEESAKLLSSPNDILAIEYIKAIIQLGAEFEVVPIKRKESSHKGDVVSDEFCSSSYIRELFLKGETSKIKDFVPWNVENMCESMELVNKDAWFNFLRGVVLSRMPEELSCYAESGGGIEYVVHREMLLAKDYESFFASLGARHLTDAKIRRLLLFLALGVKKEVFCELPEYTELLACSEMGKKLLAICRKQSEITIVSKTANIKNASETAKCQFKLQRNSEIIFDNLINGNNNQ